MKAWFLYVAECSDSTLYTGITNDISRSLYEHNYTKKGAKYTTSRRPIKLVFEMEMPSRSVASKAEYRFKKLSRKQKLKVITGEEEFTFGKV